MAGIDYFRIVAAFLVVAIHTSPLLAYSETADFILTRIIGRMAVPFFFMTSGFFLLRRRNIYHTDKLINFIKKTCLLYGLAIMIYIPINIYNGYFTIDNLLPNIVKDILFDGTLYHLWYLPASVIGGITAWLLIKQLGLKYAFITTLFLYIVGLFGDSYFGFTAQIPFFKNFYSCIFELFDYTRNGIFFAPIFFVLGGIISNKTKRISLKYNIIGLIAAFCLMLTEGLLLHNFGVQRHDSMYVFLVPCMFFLFSSLLFVKGTKLPTLKTSSAIIYIIHPMMIAVVHMIAKLFNLQTLLVDNSLINFICVITASIVFTTIVLTLQKHIKLKKPQQISAVNFDRSWIEINLDNLRHNADVLQKAMPVRCKMMAVVKADAYGHNSIVVAECLNEVGIDAFAVATIDEAITLRQNGITGEILILGYTNPLRAKELHKYNIMQTIIDYNYAVSLNEMHCKINVHIKIDTGMHRFGISENEPDEIAKLFEFEYLKICGVYTHLCVSDSSSDTDIEFTHQQISSFYKLLNSLSLKGISLPKIHIQSSYGLLNYPELKCDYVRIGIALYGVLSNLRDKTILQLDIRPVLSLKSQIALIRKVKKGESVGYNRAFTANRNSKIAILPIGYADGLPRNLSDKTVYVLIHGCPAPIIGLICMDNISIDITDIPNVNTGDIVTLIGNDGQYEVCVAELASNANTISNELLSRMGKRLKLNV